jgi:alpha-beta hydrolase superfamily lysophospholipase
MTEPMRPLYLDVRGEPVLCFLHPAAGGTQPAVLFCPPFGREDAASYRSRREWAESLAAAGVPALRFDLPATGDSGGRIDTAERLDTWVQAVSVAARFLEAETERPRIAAIGIGLGGLLAVAALAEGAPLDDLVLWGVPASGRSLVRELTAFARIEADAIVAAGGPEPPAGSPEIAPGGFLLPTRVIDALRALDLTTVRPRADGRRVLLLGRDGIPPDDALRRMLESSGATVETVDGDGFGGMMTVLPEAARLPEAVTTLIGRWLAVPTGRGSRQPTSAAGLSSQTATITENGTAIRETPLAIEDGASRLVGILAEPADAPASDLALVLLNAGAIRRTGPGRMWVELARRWAARGVPTLRIDLAGIGDGSGPRPAPTTVADLYAPEYVAQVRAAIDALARRVGARRFALLGLCAGAYLSFHTALDDDRVSQIVLLNPRLLFWDPMITADYYARSRRSKLLRVSAWRSLGATRPHALPRRLLTLLARFALDPLRLPGRRRAHQAAGEATTTAFDQLAARGVQSLFAFCDGEPLHDHLVAQGIVDQADRWPNIEFVDLPGRDHVLRPLWMHEHVYAAVDRALGAELSRAPRYFETSNARRP